LNSQGIDDEMLANENAVEKDQMAILVKHLIYGRQAEQIVGSTAQFSVKKSNFFENIKK
jgi:hypothetical protein